MKPRKMAIRHASDCAVHNGPALKPGPCDCGAVRKPRKMKPRIMWLVVRIEDGRPLVALDTRAAARHEATAYHMVRVVRVRVTEAP